MVSGSIFNARHRAGIAQIERTARQMVVHFAIACGEMAQQIGRLIEMRVDIVAIVLVLLLQRMQLLFEFAIATRHRMQALIHKIADRHADTSTEQE